MKPKVHHGEPFKPDHPIDKLSWLCAIWVDGKIGAYAAARTKRVAEKRAKWMVNAFKEALP